MTSLNPELSKQLLDAIDGLQAFPASVQGILRLTDEAGCAPRDLVEVIQNDPIVTIKVLRVVNSAYYALPRPIVSIDRAVVFLGFNTIKNLALSIAALSRLPAKDRAAFDSAGYLRHSLATAGIARALGARFAGYEAHDFFIAGLLHDFGKVVLAQVIPTEFQRAMQHAQLHQLSLHQSLVAVTGIDHASVGAMLLQKWRFPVALVEAIRGQHRGQDDSLAATSPIADCVHVANAIAKELGVDFAGSGTALPLSPRLQQIFGATLADAIAALGDVSSILQEARQFSEP